MKSAITNSFVWNWRFTFRMRGPLQAGEVVRFSVVAASTAVLNDLVLLALSSLFPALMSGGALALSFFGMRFWVFIGKRLSPGLPAKARGLPSSSQDGPSKDHRVQESMPLTSLK